MEDTPLGIIAGGGDLPFAIAESVRAGGRGVFIVALTGSADDWVNSWPHEWVSLGEVGKLLKALRSSGSKDVVLAGKLSRPKFSEVKLDAKGVLVAPRIIAAARHGDDALLRCILDLMEREGLHPVGSAEAAPGLLVPAGVMGRKAPSKDDEEDIATAFKIARAMGSLDIGQAAVVCEGLTLAVEAAEGTDAMIARVGTLPARIRGTPEDRRGVLVKAPKPTQDRRTDLPVIGVQTVRNAAAAGLTGIAVEAGGALILGKRAVVDEADKLGLFLVGVPG
jgi:DUF1009 family protein